VRYIKGLDTLRAFAVCFVIITHWGPSKFHSEVLTFIFTRILPNGTFGVDLFFVLSGYLITRILINAKESVPPEGRIGVIKAFYFRRALRIFPIYFLLVFFVYVFNDQFVRDNVLYFLTYTSNFLVFKTKYWFSISHTWSLAVEEQFYLIWPWIILFSHKKHLLKIIIFCCLLGVISSVVFQKLYGSFFFVLPLPCITALSIGSLYAYSQFDMVFNKKLISALLILLPFSIALFFVQQFGYKLSFIRVANSVIAVNVIIYVTNEKYNAITEFILNNKGLNYIGRMSYGIYLYHAILPHYYYPVINYLNRSMHFSDYTMKILTYPPPSYIIQLILVFIISYFSYNYIEVKILRLKRYFVYLPPKPNLSLSNVN
jgi:peptidoglycan/LPS O-acetylase OafA/YrhL